MSDNVIVTITGYQTNDAGETDVNETKTAGRYFFKNGAHHIVYEDEETANSARYRLSHRSLEVVKNGDLSAKMIFEAGRSFTSIYRTPYGRMPLTFVTKQFAFFEEAGILRADASYTILNEENYIVSENRIVMIVAEEGSN